MREPDMMTVYLDGDPAVPVMELDEYMLRSVLKPGETIQDFDRPVSAERFLTLCEDLYPSRRPVRLVAEMCHGMEQVQGSRSRVYDCTRNLLRAAGMQVPGEYGSVDELVRAAMAEAQLDKRSMPRDTPPIDMSVPSAPYPAREGPKPEPYDDLEVTVRYETLDVEGVLPTGLTLMCPGLNHEHPLELDLRNAVLEYLDTDKGTGLCSMHFSCVPASFMGRPYEIDGRQLDEAKVTAMTADSERTAGEYLMPVGAVLSGWDSPEGRQVWSVEAGAVDRPRVQAIDRTGAVRDMDTERPGLDQIIRNAETRSGPVSGRGQDRELER